jgi:hypothetical protein
MEVDSSSFVVTRVPAFRENFGSGLVLNAPPLHRQGVGQFSDSDEIAVFGRTLRNAHLITNQPLDAASFSSNVA